MSKQTEEKESMSFIAHLEELRWRLVKSVLSIIAGAVVLFIFTTDLINPLFMSLAHADFITYEIICKLGHLLQMGDALCMSDIDVAFMSTKMSGQFATHMYFSIIGGVALAFPVIAYQIWQFVRPGLKNTEKKATRGVVFYSTLLFVTGVLFGYFIISSLCVQFFGNYTISDQIENRFTINSYMSIITTSTFFAGILFQLPIVVFILAKMGILSPGVMKKYRKHAIVVVLLLSAIITPPDLISQIIVAIPVIILYEISIFIARRAFK